MDNKILRRELKGMSRSLPLSPLFSLLHPIPSLFKRHAQHRNRREREMRGEQRCEES